MFGINWEKIADIPCGLPSVYKIIFCFGQSIQRKSLNSMHILICQRQFRCSHPNSIVFRLQEFSQRLC